MDIGDVYISAITPVEVIAALARRSRSVGVASERAWEGVSEFRAALAAALYSLVELTPTVLADAASLAETHYLTGYDAVQLAAALAVRWTQGPGEESLILLSADDELNAAAARESLPVENPAHDA